MEKMEKFSKCSSIEYESEKDFLYDLTNEYGFNIDSVEKPINYEELFSKLKIKVNNEYIVKKDSI